MAKRFKVKEVRNAYLGNIVNTVKDKTIGAIFLAIIAAGATILLDALKNDEASDEEELFRE